MDSGIVGSKARARILIADDHPMLRSGLVYLIDRQPDLVCCAETDSVDEVWNALRTQQPDLIILDLRLDGKDGLELIKEVKAREPRSKILVLTQQAATLYVERALKAGALGFVGKEEGAEAILTAIRTVLAGEVYLTRAMAALFLSRIVREPVDSFGGGFERLSDRELHVVQLLGAGLSTREIARHLNLSFKTVETHRENIKRKLGLRGAAELVHFAMRWAGEKVALAPLARQSAAGRA
jgi:DNA-binding NarL/FixJ family response regulator